MTVKELIDVLDNIEQRDAQVFIATEDDDLREVDFIANLSHGQSHIVIYTQESEI